MQQQAEVEEDDAAPGPPTCVRRRTKQASIRPGGDVNTLALPVLDSRFTCGRSPDAAVFGLVRAVVRAGSNRRPFAFREAWPVQGGPPQATCPGRMAAAIPPLVQHHRGFPQLSLAER